MIEPKTGGQNSYDELPYQGWAVKHSHPTRLATLATLFGMAPANVESCRVLELGCAEGGNLFPMAAEFPQSEFVGIDYSTRQIDDGKKVLNQLGLTNVCLMHEDIRDIDQSFGGFDYIIVHGILSWVPAEIRTKIFEICKSNLNPRGIAFISYNTHPGGHFRRMVREMLLYHIRDIPDIREGLREARKFLEFVASSVSDGHEMYRAALEWELGHTKPLSDQHLRHDLLEEVHEAFYFSDVITTARQNGLQYLAEACFETMLPGNFAPEVFEKLKQFGGDLIQMEQYMDFLRNRTFRETLLCHDNLTLNRGIGAESLQSLYIASSLRSRSSQPDIAGCEEELFYNARKGELRTKTPLTKAAVLLLTEIWPDNISFSSLLDEARSRVGSTPDDEGILANDMLDCYANALIDFSLRPATCTSKVDAHPQSTPLARLQAASGTPITNHCHESITLDVFPRMVLCQLDGSRDYDSLLESLADIAIAEGICVERNGQRVTERDEIREILSDKLDLSLQSLASSALLVKKAA